MIVNFLIVLLYSFIHLTLLDFSLEMLDQLLKSFCVLNSNHIKKRQELCDAYPVTYKKLESV